MEQLKNDIKQYVDLRIKKFKLNLVEQLSLIFGKVLSLVVVILLAGIALMLLTGAMVVLLEMWIGSWLLSFVILGAVYIIVALLFYFKREAMFSGAMIKTFSKMMFEPKDDDDEEDEYEED